MRTAREVHSALKSMRSEMERLAPVVAKFVQRENGQIGESELELIEQWNFLRVASDSLAWVCGESALRFGPPCDWLAAHLSDSPERTGGSAESN